MQKLRLIDFVVPFLGHYRPLWQGLGTVAFDLLIVLLLRAGPQPMGAIADVFDALTSDRVYRKAMPIEKALAISPDNLEALRGLGDLGLMDCDLGRAESHYGRILEVDPKDTGAMTKMGVVRMRQGRAAEALALGGEAVFVATDVTDPNACEAMVTTCLETFGALDFAVNNAGTTAPWKPKDLESLSLDDWDRVFNVNVRGLFQVTRAAVPLLRKGEHPCIVNTASIVGLRPGPQPLPYAASKAAVRRTAVARVIIKRFITRLQANGCPRLRTGRPGPSTQSQRPLRLRSTKSFWQKIPLNNPWVPPLGRRRGNT